MADTQSDVKPISYEEVLIEAYSSDINNYALPEYSHEQYTFTGTNNVRFGDKR